MDYYQQSMAALDLAIHRVKSLDSSGLTEAQIEDICNKAEDLDDLIGCLYDDFHERLLHDKV